MEVSPRPAAPEVVEINGQDISPWTLKVELSLEPGEPEVVQRGKISQAVWRAFEAEANDCLAETASQLTKFQYLSMALRVFLLALLIVIVVQVVGMLSTTSEETADGNRSEGLGEVDLSGALMWMWLVIFLLGAIFATKAGKRALLNRTLNSAFLRLQAVCDRTSGTCGAGIRLTVEEDWDREIRCDKNWKLPRRTITIATHRVSGGCPGGPAIVTATVLEEIHAFAVPVIATAMGSKSSSNNEEDPCPKCGSTTRGGAFCSSCGLRLAAS